MGVQTYVSVEDYAKALAEIDALVGMIAAAERDSQTKNAKLRATICYLEDKVDALRKEISDLLTARRDALLDDVYAERKAEIVIAAKDELNASLMRQNEALIRHCEILNNNRQAVQDLLATIHRDGGHFTDKYGLEHSLVSATGRVAKLNAEFDEQTAKLAKAKSVMAEASSKIFRMQNGFGVVNHEGILTRLNDFILDC